MSLWFAQSPVNSLISQHSVHIWNSPQTFEKFEQSGQLRGPYITKLWESLICEETTHNIKNQEPKFNQRPKFKLLYCRIYVKTIYLFFLGKKENKNAKHILQGYVDVWAQLYKSFWRLYAVEGLTSRLCKVRNNEICYFDTSLYFYM